jgi:hypothetical protein
MYETYAWYTGKTSNEYLACKGLAKKRKDEAIGASVEEAFEIRKQNRFGLNIISFSLVFIAVLLYVLSGITIKGGGMVAGIATVILLSSAIPFFKARRIAM